ncbi:hypothetical protein TrispH2_011946 [Trichoplax sp. H2]|nr:hypothetical protein TrispH2_011946 [Trichoplax sp. H2]|eukprot:RDD36049.1 hypothetical protein TrispH2_011946 [Trichoplax sp. H2]
MEGWNYIDNALHIYEKYVCHDLPIEGLLTEIKNENLISEEEYKLINSKSSRKQKNRMLCSMLKSKKEKKTNMTSFCNLLCMQPEPKIQNCGWILHDVANDPVGLNYIRDFICALQEGKCKNNLIRIMIIGPENVGKTTLLKVLIKQSLLANEAPTQVASGNHPLIELITFDTGDMVKTGLGTLADSKVGLAVLQSPSLQVTRQTLSNMKSQRTNVFDKLLRSKYNKLRPKLSKIQEANTDSNESN